MQAEEIYYLLKPFCELGEVRGRTMAQKIFYLLQSLGYPTRLQYILHYFGPYSEDLTSFLQFASRSDPQLLVEDPKRLPPEGIRFDYRCTEPAAELIKALEKDLISPEQAETASRFCETAKAVNSKSAKVLELAATVLYFEKERGCSRAEACEKTRAMKATKADKGSMNAATALLSEISPPAR